MEKAKEFIAQNTVMIFSKSYCPYVSSSHGPTRSHPLRCLRDASIRSYCHKVKALFQGLGVPFKAVELDQIGTVFLPPNTHAVCVLTWASADEGSDIQSALKQLTGGTTVPRVFIKGEHIGGNDDTQVRVLL